MYPYFIINWVKVYSLGIWIVISLIVLIFLVYHYSKRYSINFWRFFNRIPVFLILPYLLGSYFYYAIEYFIFVPTTINELKLFLLPYGYEFSFIGISFWLFLAFIIFLKNIKIKAELNKWIDILFYSFSLTLVPLGLFLLLGDNFIGQPTDSILGVRSFFEDSRLIDYNKVYPVWLFVSMIWLLSFLLVFFINYVIKRNWVWVLGFILLIIGMNIVFFFQQYPQHWVFNMFDITFDVKNYWSFLLIIMIIVYYTLKVKRLNNKNEG